LENFEFVGYRFPAEWERHEATWLTWPYREESFPENLHVVYEQYVCFIGQIAKSEKVRINIPDEGQKAVLYSWLEKLSLGDENIQCFIHPSNDVWCRDHGPAFIVNPKAVYPKAIVDWEFNAWGGKYPSNFDNQIPQFIASTFSLPYVSPGIVMEGGSVDFNGEGDLLTTTACLLNKNRNPHLSQKQIEEYLRKYYGVHNIIWLGDGIAGDDTDGHVDDITRFVDANTIITVIEHDKSDENYEPLKENARKLAKVRLANGKQLDIVELPMPKPLYYKADRLPASYANFYFANSALIVPVFNCDADEKVLEILSNLIKDRPVVGIDSSNIVRGLGSFHCLSQQEPLV